MEESLSFSGHQSFPFRHTWLTKGVTNCAHNPNFFTLDDAMVTLGVGKNMVQSIRHWCLATRMLEEDPNTMNNRGRHLRPTAIARKLFLISGGWDPYLEDTAALWLIHWLLATNHEKATTWFYALNVLNRPDSTRRLPEEAIEVYGGEMRDTSAYGWKPRASVGA